MICNGYRITGYTHDAECYEEGSEAGKRCIRDLTQLSEVQLLRYFLEILSRHTDLGVRDRGEIKRINDEFKRREG